MNLENLLNKLLKEGKLKSSQPIFLSERVSNAVHQNFSAAKYNLQGDYLDTAFKSAYDGVLQISRVVLLLMVFGPMTADSIKPLLWSPALF